MRAGFLGTPAAAVPSLAALIDVADVPLVVTRPDRPRGRSSRPHPAPVKVAATEWGLPIAQPETATELRRVIEAAELDIGVVVAFGRILRPEVLAATRLGFVNVHFSLLPRWRGAAPVERAILAGDATTGVTLMWLDEGMDTGPVISVIETPIADDETGGSLTGRLSHLGATLLADVLPDFVTGSLHPAEQMDTAATHAAPLSTQDGRVDPGEPAVEILRRIRAMWPRPGAWLTIDDARLGVVAAAPALDAPAEGEIALIEGDPVLGTRSGGVTLITVQPEGKRRQPARTWMHGRRGRPALVDP